MANKYVYVYDQTCVFVNVRCVFGNTVYSWRHAN